jgi:hypothetical protein
VIKPVDGGRRKAVVRRAIQHNCVANDLCSTGDATPRSLLLTAVFLLMADYAFAQDPSPMQCQLIKQAVAQYGYAAARRHALETYGPEAVKTGDKCFAKQIARH